MNRRLRPLLLVLALPLAACQGPELETRTFEVKYLAAHEVERLIDPYVFHEREGRPGTLSTAEGAVTVRETGDNLDRIGRVLEEYDRPRPSVMLHFQIIRADGAGEADTAIAEVEAELRRLFRFEGYRLLAEARVGGIAGTAIRQIIRPDAPVEEQFLISAEVGDVRTRGEEPTVTLAVELSTATDSRILATTVTVPTGHAVVLGTAQPSGHPGALILVVRADVANRDGAGSEPAGSA